MRLKAITIILALTQLMLGCASFPKNPPLEKYDRSTGYRFDLIDRNENTDELFVIVTFSGGGVRAAALSFGVLEGLRDTQINVSGKRVSLLHEVDVISSVSAGSFTAAYYALKRDQIFSEFPDKFLYRDFQSEIVGQYSNPGNWFKLAGSSYGRGDLAAEFYDREIFDKATYADVIKQNRRPFVILNSTDMSTGQQFSFIQDHFDLLCSDLSGISLGRAVASSAASPVMFTPLTFQNYAGSCGYEQPGWVSAPQEYLDPQGDAQRSARAENRKSYTMPPPNRRDYVHLVDGVLTDRLALIPPLTALTSTDNSWSLRRKLKKRQIDKILVIVVDASTSPEKTWDKSPKVPGEFDTLERSITIPISNYTFGAIELLQSAAREFTADTQTIRFCKALAKRKGDQCQLDILEPHTVDIFTTRVAFDFIESSEKRQKFKNLATNFGLQKETIDELRLVGRDLLTQDREFRSFLSTVDGCLSTPKEPC